jgi:hypothetical protein
MSRTWVEAELSAEDVWNWFSRNIEGEFHKFDPLTGRFMEGEGWANTNQDIMLCIAVLYLNDFPGNRLYGNAEALEMIGRAGDALRDFQYPDGKVEFVKVDGSKWGAIYMPWSMYHWLETYRLLASQFDEGRRERWREGLQLAYEGINREMQESLDSRSETHHVVHNIPTWNAMALNRAASVLGPEEWRHTAEIMIGLTLDVQHEDGYWPEHHGPTTLYNLIYVHALGLYHRHGGSIDVIPALDKALRFHEVFTYPDGSWVETVDGRTKYSTNAFSAGLVGLALLPRGEAYVRSMIKQAMKWGTNWTTAHLADLLQHWNVKPDLASEAATLFDQDVVEEQLARAIVVKKQGWYICLSGFAAKQVDSRWGQDRQSFIGVWHEKTRLIVGGGNSKNQPEWSTFELKAADGSHAYIPYEGTVHADKREIELKYGPRALQVMLDPIDQEHIALVFESDITAEEQGVVHLPLQLRLDTALTHSCSNKSVEAETIPVTKESLQLQAGEGIHQLTHGHWQIELEGAFSLDWPSYPFNPYAQDGAADISEAVAILSIPLSAGHARQVIIKIIDTL